MRRAPCRAHWLLLAIGLPLAGCANPADKPSRTTTNEQGCVMKHHDGPQDPFKTPPPLMDTCLGPYTLRIPANYFGDQMGPNFDGSFGLYLEYPTLEPFAPGERSHLSLDVATRTVNIGYHYMDRVDVHASLRSQYTPDPGQQDNPAERLETRIQGEVTYGLTPYYADLPKIFAYYRAKGYRESLAVMQPKGHDDWYVRRDQRGDIQTVIKCTSREVTQTGVEYRDGTLVRSDEDALPKCDHFFTIPQLKVLVHINYVRVALADWSKIEDRARSALVQFGAPKTLADEAGAPR
ncbi:hypothetical protein [Xanthomonas sp. SI]|uniref:hypothetical protein n=1 Tax=Xanthomonas sp. SI TaxID=2724123 RepID=UPI001639CF88|nr:hypothetical protein [Xanthomonas sp. SI]QNH10695.1 hypothetical protein HEP75_00098 [Xanthomonas sp. SI]